MSSNIDYDINNLKTTAEWLNGISFDIEALTKSVESGNSMGEMQTQTDQLVCLLKETAENLKMLVHATYAVLNNTANRLETTDEKTGGN